MLVYTDFIFNKKALQGLVEEIEDPKVASVKIMITIKPSKAKANAE